MKKNGRILKVELMVLLRTDWSKMSEYDMRDLITFFRGNGLLLAQAKKRWPEDWLSNREGENMFKAVNRIQMLPPNEFVLLLHSTIADYRSNNRWRQIAAWIQVKRDAYDAALPIPSDGLGILLFFAIPLVLVFGLFFLVSNYW